MERHLDHAKGEPCPICDAEGNGAGKATHEELERLYAALDRVYLRPGDLIPQIRLMGRKVKSLSELSSFEVRKLIKDCEKWEKKRA